MVRARCPRSSVEAGQKCVQIKGAPKSNILLISGKLDACLHQFLKLRNENLLSTPERQCMHMISNQGFEYFLARILSAFVSMTGPVPRTTPRSALVEPRPRIRRFRHERNKCTTRGQRRTFVRRRYFSNSAWYSPHVLKAMELFSGEDADVFALETPFRVSRPLPDLDSCHCSVCVGWCSRQSPCTAGIDSVVVVGAATGGGSDGRPRTLMHTMKISWTRNFSWNCRVQ